MGELDWVAAAIGAGTTGIGGLLAFRLLASVSDFTSSRYRGVAAYQSARVDELERDVAELRDEMRDLTADNRTQHRLKHDWRSFATDLYLERATTKRFAAYRGCADVVEFLEQQERTRAENPLLVDLETLTAADRYVADPQDPPR